MNTNLTIEDIKSLVGILENLISSPHCRWDRERCVCEFCGEGDYSGYLDINHSKDCPTYKFGDLHNTLYEDIWDHEEQNA